MVPLWLICAVLAAVLCTSQSALYFAAIAVVKARFDWGPQKQKAEVHGEYRAFQVGTRYIQMPIVK